MSRSKCWKLGMVAALAIVTQTSAGFLDITQGNNVLSFGNINSEFEQSEGKIAAAGDVTLRGYGIGRNSSATLYSLISGGDVSMTWGSVLNGGIFAEGSVTLNDVNIQGSVVQYGNPANNPINFTNTYNAAVDLSNSLLSAQPNSTSRTQYGTLYLNGTNDYNYYTINASDLQSVYSLSIADQSKYSIINVIGSGSISLNSINEMNYQTSNRIDASKLLFNFGNTSSINLRSFQGSILATNADITLLGGQMYGSLVGNNITGSGQFHISDFTGNTPPQNIPESTVPALVMLGMLPLLLIFRKKSMVNA